MPQNQEFVPTGDYFGFTRQEMLDELERWKAARKKSGSSLLSSNFNGQALGFSAVRRDWTLSEWQQQIQWALYYIDPGNYPYPPPSNSAVLTDY
jgi:hypothetical protein